MNPPEIFAAGAVLWRPEAEGTKVALIHRPKYDDWTIPKGKVKKREHLLRTARREVFEETGIRPILGRRLSPSFYDKDGRPKRVDYWAATPAPNRQTATPAEGEVDQLEWLSVDEAAERLSYDRDLRVLEDFAAGPIRTVPLILLRHAATGSGSDRPEDDDTLRPLDDTGRRQAGALAKLLSCFGPATTIGSTSARCVETLLPYAIREDVSVTTEAAFTVGMTKPGQTEERLDELLAQARPTIVCGDDELLSELAELACDRLGAAAPTDPGLPEAGFRVLHIADGRLAAMERHQCPVAPPAQPES